MANTFHAAGVIATELVRRETRNGVLTTFRLAAGRPGRGQIWIDIEAWGHQAGILNTYGHPNRGVTISGRLTQKTWRDHTQKQRRRLVITANDFDFWPADLYLDPSTGIDIANHLIITGRVDDEPTHHDHTNGHPKIAFNLATGRANTKTGRLWLPIQTFGEATTAATNLHKGSHITTSGRLAYRSTPTSSQPGPGNGHYYLDATALHPIATQPAHT
jgi:single-stranded DNA-binding protein